MSITFHTTKRLYELQTVISILRTEANKESHILEIGAGTGWQAKIIAEAGYSIEAIDVTKSVYFADRVFTIQDYDGERIPFPDDYFDVVYSSNCMEHIYDVVHFQKEIHRVLKPNGFVIHVVPSATWRLWTNTAHYPYIVLKIIEWMFINSRKSLTRTALRGQLQKERSVFSVLRRVLLPHRDGERGNALTEIYYFSRWGWRALFVCTGWRIERYTSNRLFYTGYQLLGSRLSVSFRSKLSRFLGGSCHVFMIRPSAPRDM